jgi:hypothetical protein
MGPHNCRDIRNFERDLTFDQFRNVELVNAKGNVMTQMDAGGLNTAIKTYFDAIHECDVKKLDAVFHPQSSLFDADNGEIFVEPIDSFRADVAGRKSPQSAGQALEAEVLMIDFLSPLSAIVKIRIRAHHNIFVDHLGFAKGSSGWKIVSKIWHLEQVLS